MQEILDLLVFLLYVAGGLVGIWLVFAILFLWLMKGGK